MLTIGPAFERSSTELIEAYRHLPVATISDVLGPGHVMHPSVRPLRPGMRLLGAAYTLKLPPADNLGMHVAVREAKVGDVIVAEQSGGALGAPVGEIMAMAAMHKGLAGIVLNGAVRDAEKLRSEPWPVFAACIYAQQCRKDGPAWLQTTIDCAGVTVHPGDLIVGDDDGVVVERVLSGGIAKRAGMEPGDILVKINEAETTSRSELDRILQTHITGQTVILHVQPGTEKIELKVELTD
jgi:regulator of RNase E activity RraA